MKCFSMNEVDSFYVRLLEWERGVGRGVGAVRRNSRLVDSAPRAQTLRFTTFWSPTRGISSSERHAFRARSTFSKSKSVSGTTFSKVSSIFDQFQHHSKSIKNVGKRSARALLERTQNIVFLTPESSQTL